MSDTGTPFDDADPEDGWDASDPVVDLLDNISIRVNDLFTGDRPDRSGRLLRLLAHIAFIRNRVEDGDL